MKALLINASPRVNSNSMMAIQQVAKGINENRPDYEVEIVDLPKMKLAPCRACDACQATGKCVQQDDGNLLCEKILDADAIFMASPVWWYSYSDYLRILFNRMRPIKEFRKKSKVGLFLVGTCGVDHWQYESIVNEFTKMTSYIGLDPVTTIWASEQYAGKIGEQEEVMAELYDVYKAL